MKSINQSIFPLLLAAALGAVFSRWALPTTVAASSDSAQRYVAVSGSYQTGVNLLYVLDQETQHLAVYEAHGGGPNSREVVFVGARRIDLDLQLDAYNDESEYKYSDLVNEFTKRGLTKPDSKLEEVKE